MVTRISRSWPPRKNCCRARSAIGAFAMARTAPSPARSANGSRRNCRAVRSDARNGGFRLPRPVDPPAERNLVDLCGVEEKENDQGNLGHHMKCPFGPCLRDHPRSGEQHAKPQERHGCGDDAVCHPVRKHAERHEERSQHHLAKHDLSHSRPTSPASGGSAARRRNLTIVPSGKRSVSAPGRQRPFVTSAVWPRSDAVPHRLCPP